jgi:hypothetical protein
MKTREEKCGERQSKTQHAFEGVARYYPLL